MSVDVVFNGISVAERKYSRMPLDYGAIRSSSVNPNDKRRGAPRLGKATGEFDETTYEIQYNHFKGKPKVNLEHAVKPKILDGDWLEMYPALVDRWESEIANWRWGELKRGIAALALRNKRMGFALLMGSEAPWDLIEMELTAGGFLPLSRKNGKPVLTDSRLKQISRVVREMCAWGQIEFFTRSVTLEDFAKSDGKAISRYALVPTPMLLDEEDFLRRSYGEELFPQEELFTEVPHGDEEKLDEEQFEDKRENDSVYSEDFPFIKALDPDPLAQQDNTANHYANRDAPRMSLPVVPADNFYPQQPAQVVIRGFPRGNDVKIETGSVQQVSEILSTSPLGAYANIAGTEHANAMQALHDTPNPTSGEDVRTLLELLSVDDRNDVYGFIASYTTDKQKELARINDEHSGVDRLIAVIELVPTKGMKRRHVLRQIQLLISAILQDCLALWSGQIVVSYPRGEAHD